MSETKQKILIHDGPHTTEVLNVLANEIKYSESIVAITEKAAKLIEKSVDPIAGPPEYPSDGLLYGLIQSGKTSVITVASAMAVDNGFQFLLILTSNYDPLYEQTLERVRKVLRGLTVMGKDDWNDPARFQRQIRTTPFAIVCSKGVSKLRSLLDAFKMAGAKGLSTLIIDDEADQASLNTYTSKGGEQISSTNEIITQFRDFFPVNTYLQVTATPQALFLQRPDHRYRPSFTVLSAPGPGYVGGDVFFEAGSKLLKNVDLEEVDLLHTSHQPTPSGTIPTGLKKALCTFLIGATYKIIQNPADGYAFLCHVSHTKIDHQYIVNLIDRFKEETMNILQNASSVEIDRLIPQLKEAYIDLQQTQQGMPEFEKIIDKIKFYLRGASIKLINAASNEEIKLDSVYNIFVGGNKLGRGVTIKNLLVSYYGRNPKKPNADTVLQHARMYGYRQNDLGVTRLFLPEKLSEHFRLIHQMESALRDLVEKYPEGKFEGIFISSPLHATRPNVLDPNSIGIYVAGGYCNPSYPLRTDEVADNTEWLDKMLSQFDNGQPYSEVNIELLEEIIQKCKHDPRYGAELWNHKTLIAALDQIKSLYGNKAYIVVKRGRDLNEPRRETQNFLSGGEDNLAPKDAPTLFIYKLKKSNKGMEAWWPALRFPDGNYVLAFSFER
ncbi:MAG: Z1 domain protein [Parcubacteria group bacterium ADurb.Bin115]|nr:MAG: Z1 domain protein [Parcubacteria group bacterium ADurb.Bin115]